MVGLDPFRHHPELRPLIGDPLASPLRNLDLAAIDATLAEQGHGPDWRYSDSEREARRLELIEGHTGPLWVFAYGSLMWNPSMQFDEVRPARAPGHARHFCLWDETGRGSPEVPGLQAALDTDPGGPGCQGLAFRIPAALVPEESRILWERELIAEGYVARFISLETPGGPVESVAFLANFDSPKIRRDLSLDAQAAMIARACGLLGPNTDYLDNLVEHFRTLGIEDADLSDLAARVAALAHRQAGPSGA